MAKPKAKLTCRRRRLRSAGRKGLWAAGITLVVAAMVLADRLGAFGWAPQADYDKYDGGQFRVVRVIDGDTIDVDVPDRHFGPHTRIRFWGVDTPETVKPDTPPQHFGPEAAEFVRTICLGRTVRLELDRMRTRDKYERVLAYVFLPDGRMLNRLLIEEGYGYADPRFAHRYKSEFARLQRQAKNRRRGLWHEVTKADLPYYYKDGLKLPREEAPVQNNE